MNAREDFLDYLDTIIGQAVAHGDTPDASRFAITDDSQADWALRKVNQAQAHIDERKAFVEAEIERLHTWQAAEDEKDDRTITHFTGLLNDYYRVLTEKGALGKSKSYRLPHGTLSMRKTQAKFTYDEEKLLNYLRMTAPEMIDVKERVRWADFKPQLDIKGTVVVDVATGEVVECVKIESPEGECFSAKGAE